MLALKTIPEISITVIGNHINYTQTEVVTNLAPNSRKYHPYKKNTRSYTGIHLPELLKLALRKNLMLTPISIPPNATIQQRLQLCLNEENTEYPPIYRYFYIRKTLYEWKLELTTANLTKEAIQKQLHNEFKTTAGLTNSCYRLRAALRLYDLFHTCENILQNPIFQPLKIQYIEKLTELKFQQFSDQISSIILDYYLEITNSTWTLMELSLEEEKREFTTKLTLTTFEKRDQKPPITPHSPDSGHHSQFPLVTFNSQGNLDSAVIKTGTLRKCCIWWETPGCWHCFKCQEIGHLDCKISLPPTSKVLKIFKSHFVGSVLYAKTAAPSEFPSLVTSSAAFVADPAVSFRLDSLEKQISDLAALVRSIAEPVGSLVALVSRLLDDNAVKAIQIKKDIISIKSAANNFSNLMVRVFKDIVCLRSEVDFGNMDYDGMLAVKPSFLSEDTIEHVIALCKFIFDSRNLNGIIERIYGLELFSPTFDSA
ncbi:hypothetical protein G9A89_010321 [Geosiphon pyriformis]|nr:hypothetical protein G9A89_010321 [Geosiphon pyriformis]